MLKVTGLEVYHGWVRALRGVSLQVSPGETVAVLGANGAGKSTLLGALAGLYQPQKGEVLLKGRPVAGRPPEYLVRQGVSLVPEHREIFSTLSVWDNLMVGAYHRYRTCREEINEDLEKVMHLFPALRGREKEPAGRLSGGVQQMLAIGRGLMARPGLLLLDEPSVGLAPLVVREVMSALAELKNKGMTIILVEQNTVAALKVADRALVMERGRVTMNSVSGDVDHAGMRRAYLGREVK
ncbi:MAG: ABC-type branched-chain amino acid transport system, ATPase component [Pelotomaculum thermopropionicum]|uniref:ABC-type branched-chain amino acid transport system, ATPase component n=1 Tax=Pelotomaculum thermopropionicum TaxID=110500 RepID=A0A124FZ23_9FIRM|nr:MAG: ABC-type branched-chain amino acid transport system, ATPase component [Pelotomaculum thermopropionicum]